MADANNTATTRPDDCIRRPFARYTTCRCARCGPVVKRIYKLARSGKLDRPASADAWALLDEWIDAGYTPAWIASACGMPRSSIESAFADRAAGQVRTFGPERARLIINADITAGTSGYCSARGDRRRLQALASIGYSGAAMQKHSAIHFVTLACIQRGQTARISASLHHRIGQMYDELDHIEGPSRAVASRARNKGWEPPNAWDDIDHDPEFDEPQIEGRADIVQQEYEFLSAAGESFAEIARRLGLKEGSLRTTVQRYRKAA